MLQLAHQLLKDEITAVDSKTILRDIYNTYCSSSLGYFIETAKTFSEYEQKLSSLMIDDSEYQLKVILEEEEQMMLAKKYIQSLFSEKQAQGIDVAGFLVYLKDHYKFQVNRIQYAAE